MFLFAPGTGIAFFIMYLMNGEMYGYMGLKPWMCWLFVALDFIFIILTIISIIIGIIKHKKD